MKQAFWIGAAMLGASYVKGQTLSNTHLLLNGPPQQRVLLDVGPPTVTTSAVTVRWAANGQAQWATASVVGQVLVLGSDGPPMSTIRPGTLLRFINPTGSDAGPFYWTLQYMGLEALPLLKADGLPVLPGQLRPGVVSEVVYGGEAWVLAGRSERFCPPGFTNVDPQYCIQTNDLPATMGFFPAVEACHALGARLCTWEEFYFACTHLEGQLSGTFDGWEWIDDVSNHGHTADVVGRYTCKDLSDRSPSNANVQVRCCYSLR